MSGWSAGSSGRSGYWGRFEEAFDVVVRGEFLGGEFAPRWPGGFDASAFCCAALDCAGQAAVAGGRGGAGGERSGRVAAGAVEDAGGQAGVGAGAELLDHEDRHAVSGRPISPAG